MQTRKLGYTGLNLSVIGFGAWALGGPWEWGWGQQDDQASISAIHRAIDLGVTWIDTAAAYGLGHSEEVVGRALRDRRDQVLVFTKCGLVWDDPSSGRVVNRLKRGSVRAEAEGSLRRLGIDAIDLYQIHWPNPDQDIEEAWEEMARLVEEGKVHYIGVSNFNVEQLKRMQKIFPVASLQPSYSMVDREVEDELLGFCAQNKIGVIAYSPMSSGLLTGKYTREKIEALPADDWRRAHNDHFREPELSANLEMLDRLRPVADRLGMTLAQLALAWVLRRPEVTGAIVGARSPRQIEETVAAGDVALTPDQAAEIDGLLQRREAALAA